MTTHISARLAWHLDGWNGRICREPASNTYCVGHYSYPGQYIAEQRDLAWETTQAGQAGGKLSAIPPCCYSYNAFGAEEVPAQALPPAWFQGCKPCRWELPPATAGVWPYEEMYREELKKNGKFDQKARREKALEYFGKLVPDKSLIFYYANYSNPFSEDDSKRYALIGVARLKAVGEELFYPCCPKDIQQQYAGAFVWQRAITSHYPEQGLRLPYHKYRSDPELLSRLALFPDNPRVCKYGTRHLSDDDALGLVEAFHGKVLELLEMGDQTEDWSVRARWLESLMAELWQHRGLFPGLPSVLDAIGFSEAVPFVKDRVLAGHEKDARDAVFAFLDGKRADTPGLKLSPARIVQIQKRWRLQSPEAQHLLREVLPRFALTAEQISKILDEKLAEHGIRVDLAALADNPYILAEQYQGDDPDDIIPWGTIDRGVLPSPGLGGERLVEPDDGRRLRALLVAALQQDDPHVFSPAALILQRVNERLAALPDWKRFTFHERYLDAEEDIITAAVIQRREQGQAYLYLRDLYEDERLIEEKLRFLIGGPDITLRSPVTTEIWKSYLYDPHSVLAHKKAEEYQEAIDQQIAACQRVFCRPLSVLAGEAGTGKTTVIRAIIKAIKRGHGEGSAVLALAPTGKAADRIREVIEKDESLRYQVEVATIHSFLAKKGWLNPNLTFKRSGGQQEEGYATYILDEASMLDLALAAAFFRAVRWPTVQRLILVGDPNQLPPIGRGRVFADVIDFIRQEAPESMATLVKNLRQLGGQVAGGATGIIDLAQCYVSTRQEEVKNEDTTTAAEQMLQRVQMGGEVAPDLRVLYWQDREDLHRLLLSQLAQDLASDVRERGETPETELSRLWRQAHQDNSRPSYLQIISPYRGEFFGIEEINRICQETLRGQRPAGSNALDGIMLFDKVIQIRNRPQSQPIWAWDHNRRRITTIEIFNGQIGFVCPHGFDKKKWKSPSFRLEKFWVNFDRREAFSVGYGKNLGKDANGQKLPDESVEENLELAYAISAHKAQGSEFERVYVIIPKHKTPLLTTELFYTALTRARRHCTVLVEQDISPLLGMRRLEAARLRRINASLFPLFRFQPLPTQMLNFTGWYEDGRIHQTLTGCLVRSKSEVKIANKLAERDIPFAYEKPLFAPDGTFFLPDFTVTWRGTDFFWEHIGLLHDPAYHKHWDKKKGLV